MADDTVPGFDASWEAFSADQDRAAGLLAVVVGVTSQPLWSVLDYVTQPAAWWVYLWPRVGLTIGCALAIPLIARLRDANAIRAVVLGLFLYGGYGAGATVPHAGEYYSLYVLGFSLLLWAGGCVLAWPISWSVVLFGGLVAEFALLHAWFGTPESASSLAVSAGYLATAFVLCAGSSIGRYRAGWRIHSANWALRARNQELATSRLEVVEARAMAESKNAFMERMSHELRTPLNAILGYTEMVQEELEDAGLPELVSDLDRVTRAGDHLRTLVSDILDLSAIEAGQVPFDPRDVDLAELVGTLVGEVTPAAHDKSLSISSEGPAIPVWHDPVRLRQVLVALLSNAVKFTESGTVEVRTGSGDGMASVAVLDTGPGVDPADHERIFGSFEQGDGSRTRRHDGAGLGLAVARGLARSMGGDIDVASRDGGGSVFTLRVPIEYAGSRPTAEAS